MTAPKITKRARERAVLLCDIAASNDCDDYGKIATQLDWDPFGVEVRLAFAAWFHVSDCWPRDALNYHDAAVEANTASFIRDGGVPEHWYDVESQSPSCPATRKK